MKSKNYLDYIPSSGKYVTSVAGKNGKLSLVVKNRGIFHFIAHHLYGSPASSSFELDEIGSYVWSQINGEKTIYEIGLLLKEKYGGRVTPLYERLADFFTMLCRSNAVLLREKSTGNRT